MMGGGYGYGYGPGMMGGGYGYGPGMMGRGGVIQGPGGCGPCWGPGAAGGGGPGVQREDLKLSVDQVRSNMDGWVKRMGNPRLKLGKVVERDADTITADVVTSEKDVVVQRYEINRHSGFIRPAR
ncbi:hypothetical protein PEP31012_04178 [Pandoraea eparura]|uniref:Uncharacterized protein n=2 Tax=Pandoraea eparura TaxID=2508291 RepID=A0A5E4XX66_9BURK|nr:hypothetical protein PEP31012_04178 [Pandoraea eparura]